jgi:AraC-like DNA-binding protein/HAMP domain-containing protein
MLATAGRILHQLLQRNGLDADALYLECGLDPIKLDDARARYPLERNRALWRLAHERIKDPCWGLAAGEVWRPTDFHALGCAFLASRTLESALIRLERFYRIVIQDVALQVTADQDHYSITYAPPSPDADIPPLQDTRWSVILRMCREAYGPDLPLHEVQLTHPWQACGYEQYFGCPVRYESDRSGLTFPLEAMRRPLRAMNQEMARASDRILSDFDRCLADTSIRGRVRRAVLDALPSGKPSATSVAKGLALAPRTLQRKLQEEGTTFQEVSDTVRKELAQQYVQSGEYDLGAVTYLTGFATLSAFSRAYKGWTGRTPSEDRGRG